MGRPIKKNYGGGSFSRIKIEVQLSDAFLTASGAVKSVYLYMVFLAYSTGTREGTSAPQFRFTTNMAKDKLKMSSQVFTRSKKELEKRGLIKVVKRGGLRGCNGVATVFELSSNWKNWKDLTKKRASPFGNDGGIVSGNDG